MARPEGGRFLLDSEFLKRLAFDLFPWSISAHVLEQGDDFVTLQPPSMQRHYLQQSCL
jgi:hypothetical protein